MAIGIDDLLVADSEDEGVFTQLPPADGSGISAVACSVPAGNWIPPDTSAIQTAVSPSGQPRTPQRGSQSPSTLANESLFTPPGGGMNSTISNFSDTALASGAPLRVPHTTRPRPRVVMRKVMTSDHDAAGASAPLSHISDPPVSAAARSNDSIHPETASHSEAIDDLYSFNIAERAKMRSRRSQIMKKPIRPQYTNEVIELTSDEDELVLKPTKRQKRQGNPVPKLQVQTRPRPKPTLKVKPAVALPSGSPSSRTMIRDPPMLSAQCAASSQPPTSTLPTIPPSTPPQARELTPLSSPLVTIRKRKRIPPVVAEDDDEIDTTGGIPIEPSPPFIQPPPFFAPSSSSLPTDSGVEIPPVESPGSRVKKKQASSSGKKTQTKTQNKGRRGKRTTNAIETVEELTRVTPEPPTPANNHSSSTAKECHSPMVKSSAAARKTSGKQTVMKKGKNRVIDSCEEQDELATPARSHIPVDEREDQRSKENLRPGETSSPRQDLSPERTSTSDPRVRGFSVKPTSTPMSELIRRVNSQPNSPFPNTSRTYSPLLKSSRTMLSRIAPLHPNRRTPPPPLPRPPPPKKSKKQLEMEERIEEELAETIDGWSCLTDEERKALRRARVDAELGYE